MDRLYELIGIILPFEWAQPLYMKNALLAVIISAVLFGLIGTMAVDNKMAYFSEALGHSALTGIAIGAALGFDSFYVSLISFGIIMALLIQKVKSSETASADTIISVFSSTALGLGLLLLSRSGNAAMFNSFLVGDILSVTQQDVKYLFFVALIIIVVWYFTYNKLLLISINRTLAASRGIKVKLYEYLFIIIVAVVVMLSIKWIGMLLINSLLILPVATARNIAKSARLYTLLSIAFGLFASVFGLISSWYFEISASAAIVIILAICFAITYFSRFAFGKSK